MVVDGACAVMRGMPAALAYAKYFSTSASVSRSKLITPPPTITRPAAWISRRAAASWSGDRSNGKCTDFRFT
jgi:hypothetical protein